MPNYLDIIDGQAVVSSDDCQFNALLSVFHRACGHLDLGAQDASTARAIARSIIEGALAGELDADGLYERALQAVLAS